MILCYKFLVSFFPKRINMSPLHENTCYIYSHFGEIRLSFNWCVFWGTTLTAPLVSALQKIHNDTFGIAGRKIREYQKKYKRRYDQRKRTASFALRKGVPVQVKKLRYKKAKGSKNDLRWYPRDAFYTIHKIDKSRKRVFLKNPRTQKVLKKTQAFDHVRIYHGPT